jgi:hypothetical protein
MVLDYKEAMEVLGCMRAEVELSLLLEFIGNSCQPFKILSPQTKLLYSPIIE